MKFVVPLTIPSTRWTFATTSDSRSTFITGIAAHTQASKRSWTPAVRGGGEELRAAPRDPAACSRPDGLARRAAGRAHSRRWLEAAHHLRDEPDRRVVAIVGEVGGQNAVVGLELPLHSGRARARATTRSRWPVARSMSSACSRSSRLTARADRPVAKKRDGDVDRTQGSPVGCSRFIERAGSSCADGFDPLVWWPSSRSSRRWRLVRRPSGRRSTRARRPPSRMSASSRRTSSSRTWSSTTTGPRVQVAVLGRVGDRVAHAGEPALVDQVDDQLSSCRHSE